MSAPSPALFLASVMAIFCTLLVAVDGTPTPPECSPSCAPGQTCVRVETCYPDGCTEATECEGTPDDCRTNGCPDDATECRPEPGGGHSCQAKACVSRPTWAGDPAGWTCVDWGRECCYRWEWRQE